MRRLICIQPAHFQSFFLKYTSTLPAAVQHARTDRHIDARKAETHSFHPCFHCESSNKHNSNWAFWIKLEVEGAVQCGAMCRWRGVGSLKYRD